MRGSDASKMPLLIERPEQQGSTLEIHVLNCADNLI